MPINIIVKGEKESLPAVTSIEGLLKNKNIWQEVVTIELNDVIIDRKEYGSIELKEGDRLEFVYYMGGGTPTSSGKSQQPNPNNQIPTTKSQQPNPNNQVPMTKLRREL